MERDGGPTALVRLLLSEHRDQNKGIFDGNCYRLSRKDEQVKKKKEKRGLNYLCHHTQS